MQSYKSSSVKVRFRLASDPGDVVGNGWHIDDVRIEEKDAVRLEYPFVDDFEDGSDNWILSGWDWGLIETIPPPCNSYRYTHSITDSPSDTSGNYSPYIPFSNCSATLPHPIDLTGANNPVLRFAHKGDFGSGDYGAVDVSTDGGSSWTPVASWQGSFKSFTGCLDTATVALRDYKSSSVKVRFRLASNSDESVGDGWIVDYVRIREADDLTGVNDQEDNWMPSVLTLEQNHPNPFNPSTTIRYYLTNECQAKLEVYDSSGKRIACLVDAQQKQGPYAIDWNGRDERGVSVSSGVYFYRLTAGKETISKKMVLLK